MSLISFEYYYSLTEVTKIDIDQINNLKDEKLYVLVIGSIASGKTFLSKKFIGLPIIDVDNYVTEFGNGKYNRNNLGKGRLLYKNEFNKMINDENSFVDMGTGSNLQGTKNRLSLAKQNNFTTILVYIDASPQQSFQQSQQRFNSGERNEIPFERIEKTYNDSMKTFNELKKDNKLVDFYVIKKNIINI